MTVAQPHDKHATLPDGLLKRSTFLLWRLGAVGRRRLAAQLAAVDLAAPLPDHRLPHLSVLTCLADSGPSSQREIADRLDKDCSDIVAILDDLEHGTLVVRRRDERDRRRHLVSLTPAGRRALRRLDGQADRVEDAMLAPLSDDEREVLHDLLLRVLAHHDATSRTRGAPEPPDGGTAQPSSGTATAWTPPGRRRTNPASSSSTTAAATAAAGRPLSTASRDTAST